MTVVVSWRADNAARVRFPLSAETRALLGAVREGREKVLGVSFSDRMVRAILRGAKEQTSRTRPIRGWEPGRIAAVREAWASADGFLRSHESRPPETVVYRSDLAAEDSTGLVSQREIDRWNTKSIRWGTAMLQPRATTRLLVRATALPYEKRIGDFDLDDVLREGCPIPSSDPEGAASFRDVWTGINGSFDDDTRVFVHRFEVFR